MIGVNISQHTQLSTVSQCVVDINRAPPQKWQPGCAVCSAPKEPRVIMHLCQRVCRRNDYCDQCAPVPSAPQWTPMHANMDKIATVWRRHGQQTEVS